MFFVCACFFLCVSRGSGGVNIEKHMKNVLLLKKSIKKINIKVEADAINKPPAAEAQVIANTTSDDDKGLCTTSVIVPIIFPIIKEELE